MTKLRIPLFSVVLPLALVVAITSAAAQGEITCETPARIGADQRLTAESALSDASSVVWAGNSYGVAWADRRYGIYDQIWFMRLDAIGGELQAATPITFVSAYSQEPSLVWTGSEYGLVFSRSSRIYFTRISSAGAKIGNDIPISDAGGVAQSPSLVWTGAEYGVAWQDARDGNDEIYFIRLDSAGAGMGGEIRVTSDSASSRTPRLVHTGAEFALAWTDARAGNDEIYFARLDAFGSKLTMDLRITSDTAVSETPDLAWTGSEYGLVWRDRRDGNGEIYFALLTAAGVQVGSDVPVTISAGNSALPRLQWTGNEYGVTWRDRRDGNNEIYFTHLDSVGLKLSPDLRVTSAAAESTAPSMVWRGNSFGITWTDDRDGNEEIYFTRISCACGNDDDGDGFTVCNGDCDETDDTVYPGATQVCDGLNNDCDDPGWPAIPAVEVDGDGDGLSFCAGDCIDSDDQVYPGAPQICDGVNNDCDHPSWPALTSTNDGDNDGDSWSSCAGDCDDANAMVYPGAPQICDGLNNDCNHPDWPDPALEASDNDGDGLSVCVGDCDDGSAAIYPGAPQVCDGVNNDCSHPSWPGTADTTEADDDGDGLSECQGDCDDTLAITYPGAPEVCDLLDNDCNGLVDENFDLDSDGVATCAGDCDDTDPNIYPGAPEICDGLNNDCNHPSWPALTGNEEVDDLDGDGFTFCQNDCDVLDAAINPDAIEACDGKDNNCDGFIDDLPGCDNGCELADAALPEINLTTNSSNLYNDPSPTIVRAGNGFAIAWSGSQGGALFEHIYFALLDAAGTLVGPIHQVTSGAYDAYTPDLVWTGSEFGIAWQDERHDDYLKDIYFVRLDATGQKIDEEVRITSAQDRVYAPDLVWTGTDYGLVWVARYPYQPRFIRLSASGVPQGPEIALDSSSTTQSVVAWTGTHYAIVWPDIRHGGRELYVGIIDPQGNLVQEVRVTETAGSSNTPRIVWTGSELGLFWKEYKAGTYQLYFTRLGRFGTRLSEDLALTQDSFNVIDHELAWTGEEYGIAMRAYLAGEKRSFFLRVDPLGIPMGSGNMIQNLDGISTAVDSIRVAWNGQLYGTLGIAETTFDFQTRTWGYPLRFSQVLCGCVDSDGDGSTNCRDCDDTNTSIYFTAPQTCDGLNNDCYAPSWPALTTTNEFDDDLDGLSECAGDCDDAHATVYPGAPEVCDGFNDDCNAPDWPSLAATDENTTCVIDLQLGSEGQFVWDSPTPYGAWNVYRGKLSVLTAIPIGLTGAGLWTQAPGSNSLAAQTCGLAQAELDDTPPLAPGEVAFYFTTGLTGTIESGLGQWVTPSAAGQRLNENPCP